MLQISFFGKFIVTLSISFLLLSIYPTSKLFVSASTESEILRGHTNAISSIDVSQDGRLIVTGSIDRTVRLWNTQTGKTVLTLRGHNSEIYAVKFSPDNQLVASSGYDGRVILWSVKSGKPLRTLELTSWSVAIAFSPDSRQLAVGSQERNIFIYDARNGNIVQTLETNFGIYALAFSPDGRYLAEGSFSIAIWNLQTGKIVRTLQGHQNSLRAIAFSKDGLFLVSGSVDKTARLWNVETGETVKIFQTETPVTLKLQSRNLNLKWKMPVTCVAFSPDDKTLAMGTGRAIHLWDISTGNAVKILEGHEQSVTGVVFLSDRNSLASSSLDGTVRLWSF